MKRVTFWILLSVTTIIVLTGYTVFAEDQDGSTFSGSWLNNELPSTKEQDYNAGTDFSNRKMYTEALDMFKLAVRASGPHELDPWIYNNWGAALNELGEYQEAIVKFDMALSIDSSFKMVQNNRKIAEKNVKKFGSKSTETGGSASGTVSGMSSSKSSKDWRDWQWEGKGLYDAGQYEEALKKYEKSIELYPDNRNVYIDKGKALQALGRYDDAIGAYDKALELKPDLFWPWAYKGNVLEKLGRDEDALDAYNMAMKNCNGLFLNEFGGMKGALLEKMGRIDEALETYNEIVKTYQKDQNALERISAITGGNN
jgi:tetratricopeptide (TPR) repeat protein